MMLLLRCWNNIILLRHVLQPFFRSTPSTQPFAHQQCCSLMKRGFFSLSHSSETEKKRRKRTKTLFNSHHILIQKKQRLTKQECSFFFWKGQSWKRAGEISSKFTRILHFYFSLCFNETFPTYCLFCFLIIHYVAVDKT